MYQILWQFVYPGPRYGEKCEFLGVARNVKIAHKRFFIISISKIVVCSGVVLCEKFHVKRSIMGRDMALKS